MYIQSKVKPSRHDVESRGLAHTVSDSLH
eukprot:COSAG06_NODE_61913_length_266_cov_0.916168_1_plen_28_part_10